MSAITIKELRGMELSDLRKEIRAQGTLVQKMRIQITMNTEKDSAKYRRERKMLARMLTVLTEKAKDSLQKPKKASTVAASSTRSRTRKSAKKA